MPDTHHTPTRLLVLRERDTMLEVARHKLSASQIAEVIRETEEALGFPDDEATLVLATIKDAWGL